MKFQQYLDDRIDEFCPDCPGDIRNCPLLKAILQSYFSDVEFCPRCFGYRIGQEPRTEKVEKKSKSGAKIEQEVTKLVNLYSGGQLVLITPDRSKEQCHACCCHAGERFKTTRRYDPSFRNDTRCWFRIKDDHTAWLMEQTSHWQKEPSKLTGFTPLIEVLKKSIPKPEDEFLASLDNL